MVVEFHYICLPGLHFIVDALLGPSKIIVQGYIILLGYLNIPGDAPLIQWVRGVGHHNSNMYPLNNTFIEVLLFI